jgi:hypothetical protein
MADGDAVPFWWKAISLVGFLLAGVLAWHAWVMYQWDRDDVRAWAVHVHQCHLPQLPPTASSTPDMQGHSTSSTCAEMPTHIPPPPPPPKY